MSDADRLRQAADRLDANPPFIAQQSTDGAVFKADWVRMREWGDLLRAVADENPCCCLGATRAVGCPWHDQRDRLPARLVLPAALALADVILGGDS